MTDQKQRVLFLCTHNSARSQMAEALLRDLAGDRFQAYSAGTEATQVRPLAIRAMAEQGIDISDQESKTLDRYLGEPFDAVITVCDQAAEACPVFPAANKRLHWSFPDPSQAAGSEDEQLAAYRSVRDAIRSRIERELLSGSEGGTRPWTCGGRARQPPERRQAGGSTRRAPLPPTGSTPPWSRRWKSSASI